MYASGSYASENNFTIVGCDGTVIAEMLSGSDGFGDCVDLPVIYTITLTDSYGDSWNGGTLTVGDMVYEQVGDYGWPYTSDSSESFNVGGDCPNTVITLCDSYGDSWNGGTLTVAGMVYEQVGDYSWPYTSDTCESFEVSLDLDACNDVLYTAGSYSYENSWSITDLDGNVLASSADAVSYTHLTLPTIYSV